MHKIGINSLADYIVLSYASQLNRNNIIRALSGFAGPFPAITSKQHQRVQLEIVDILASRSSKIQFNFLNTFCKRSVNLQFRCCSNSRC